METEATEDKPKVKDIGAEGDTGQGQIVIETENGTADQKEIEGNGKQESESETINEEVQSINDSKSDSEKSEAVTIISVSENGESVSQEQAEDGKQNAEETNSDSNDGLLASGNNIEPQSDTSDKGDNTQKEEVNDETEAVLTNGMTKEQKPTEEASEEKRTLENDENGNFQEISEDLMVVRQPEVASSGGEKLDSGEEAESKEDDLDSVLSLTESEVKSLLDKVPLSHEEKGNKSDDDEEDETQDLEEEEEEKEEDLKKKEVLEEQIPEEQELDVDEDQSASTDTSNLANIIVKHVLDSAVSTFNNDSSFSSDEEVEESSSNRAVEAAVTKRSGEHDESDGEKSPDLKLDLDALKADDESPSDEGSSASGDVHFDENGNRKGEPEQSVNPVAMDIAVAMVKDQTEAEENKITDQIREDIKEISKHIKLNDTVETEQNVSRTVENGDDRLSSENELLSSQDSEKNKALFNRQQSEEPDSPCGSQGLPKLDPLPNYPDYPINYGNYKVCRNLSPREKECIVLETGEIFTSNDKGRSYSDVQTEVNRRIERPEVIEDQVIDSSAFERSSTPHQALNNSQPLVGSDGLRSPVRSGESSFRILKSSYDMNRHSPITSPRDEYKANNLPREQTMSVPSGQDAIGYAHVNLSQSQHIENESVTPSSHMNQNVLFKRQDDHDDELRRRQERISVNHQRLNNEASNQNRVQSPARMQPNLSQSSTRNLYQTEGEIDLSDPSVMVRYQRNLLQQNITNSYIPPPEQFQTLQPMSESDSVLLSQLYAKYGNSVLSSKNMTGSYSEDITSSTEAVSTPPRSGPVPGYRTLQEQQNTWMQMFHTLEEKHQLDLQQQNRLHREALFNLQQQMEGELYDQQKLFRQKLNTHKETLSQTLNRSLSPIHHSFDESRQYSRINDSQISRTTDDLTDRKDKTLSYQETFHTHNSLLRNRSPSWREIYREIRGVEASDEEISSPREPVRRSLDKEFTGSPRSRSNEFTGSPRSRSNEFTGSPRSRSNAEPQRQSDQPIIRQSLSPRERQSRSEHVERPRAGVYSSPMPILRGKVNNSQSDHQTSPRGDNRGRNTSHRVSSPSERTQNLQRSLEVQQQERILLQQSLRDSELTGDSTNSDDVNVSASSRVSLREKHAKHMADLREYYEKELRDLRSSLLADMAEQSPFKKVSSENQNLVIENRLLREKIEDLENSMTDLNRQNRELEQRNHGLEVRAKEYAENFNESQAKVSNFRNKMEELQFYYREKDETSQQLEYQVKHLNNKLRAAQKANHELTEQINRERGVLQKISDKYDAAERDIQMTKECLSSTENKLYDARTEIVELKRMVARLELENKRLSRENDSILHRKMNSSSLHGSFHESFEAPKTDSVPCPCDSPGISSSPRGVNSPREDRASRLTQDSYVTRDRLNGSTSEITSHSRTKSPHRSSVNGLADGNESVLTNGRESADSKVSPVMRAEQDLYRLRDMMREVQQSPIDQPSFKLKKKFYGSDIQTQSRNSDYSPSRGGSRSPKFNRRKSPSNSPKTKTTKSRRSQEPVNGHVTNNKGQRPSSKLSVNPDEFSSPTRFDVRVDTNHQNGGSPRGVDTRRQQGDGEPQKSSETKPSTRKSKSESSKGKKPKKILNGSQESRNEVEDTLNKIKTGEYITRPEWEDLYTSMAKPPENQTVHALPKEDTIKQRINSISDLEHRYDDLTVEKRKLESALSRIPLHGKGRLEKERVEEKLDHLEKELGSLRMSLKRYNVLKTSI